MTSAKVNPFRVLLVDDHQVVRIGLKMVFNDSPELQVVGEAATAAEALSRCGELKPDVVVMDIRLPGASGFDACRWIKDAHPGTRVIFVTSYSDDVCLANAIAAGADGYILKAIDGPDICEAVIKAAGGGAVLDPLMTRQVFESMRQGPKPSAPQRFTERERRMLELLAIGQTNKEIASEIKLAEKTVRNALTHIFEKLGAANRTEAASAWRRENRG